MKQHPENENPNLAGIKHIIVVSSGKGAWANPPQRSIWRWR